MRERTHLDNALRGFRELEQALTDNIELLKMAEAENDKDLTAEAENALFALKDAAQRRER